MCIYQDHVIPVQVKSGRYVAVNVHQRVWIPILYGRLSVNPDVNVHLSNPSCMKEGVLKPPNALSSSNISTSDKETLFCVWFLQLPFKLQ